MWISCVWPGIQRLSWFGWWGNGVSNSLGSNNLNHTKWWPNGSFRISTYVFDLLVFCLSHTASLAICSLWKGSQKAPLLLVQLRWPPPQWLPSTPATILTMQWIHKFIPFSPGAHLRLVLSAEAQGTVLRKLSGPWNFQHLTILSSCACFFMGWCSLRKFRRSGDPICHFSVSSTSLKWCCTSRCSSTTINS